MHKLYVRNETLWSEISFVLHGLLVAPFIMTFGHLTFLHFLPHFLFIQINSVQLLLFCMQLINWNRNKSRYSKCLIILEWNWKFCYNWRHNSCDYITFDFITSTMSSFLVSFFHLKEAHFSTKKKCKERSCELNKAVIRTKKFAEPIKQIVSQESDDMMIFLCISNSQKKLCMNIHIDASVHFRSSYVYSLSSFHTMCSKR